MKGSKKIKGVLDADSIEEAEKKLFKIYGYSRRIRIRKKAFWERSTKLVNSSSKMLFYRQMEAMLKCGISLPECLKLSASAMPDSSFAMQLLEIEAGVLSGRYMHNCIEGNKNFSNIEKALIAAGEESASLDAIFRRLYEYFKNIFKVKSKITESIVYPLSIIIVMVVVLIVISRVVVPKFLEIYESIGVDLPFFTSLVLDAVRGFIYFAPFSFLFFAVLYFSLRRITKNPKYKEKWDRFILGLPQIGEILITSHWAQIMRALEVLIAAGVDINKALQHSIDVSDRIPIKKVLEDASDAVLKGRMVYTSLQRNMEYIPPIAVGMIAAGENSGSLEKMLATTAEYLEDELSHRIELFMKLLEPALIVIVGIAVGLVVLALYLPVFTLASKM